MDKRWKNLGIIIAAAVVIFLVYTILSGLLVKSITFEEGYDLLQEGLDTAANPELTSLESYNSQKDFVIGFKQSLSSYQRNEAVEALEEFSDVYVIYYGLMIAGEEFFGGTEQLILAGSDGMCNYLDLLEERPALIDGIAEKQTELQGKINNFMNKYPDEAAYATFIRMDIQFGSLAEAKNIAEEQYSEAIASC